MIATLALLLWVPLTIALFVLYPTQPLRAAGLSILGGAILLPCGTGLDLPVLPQLDKHVLPVVVSALLAAVNARGRLSRARPGSGGDLFIVVMIAGALVTNGLNSDPLVIGAAYRPGNSPLDTVNDAVYILLCWWLPYFLGRALVTSPSEARELLVMMAVGGAFYVPLFFIELAIGPVLHKKLYGYHPSDFSQALRFDGVRPVILMTHGLVTSGFLLYATHAAVALARGGVRIVKISAWPIVGALGVTLVLCKSVGVWVLGSITLPVALVAPPRLQVRVAAVLAALTLLYPLIREADLLPTDTLIELVRENISDHHAQSIHTRFSTEDDVLERVRQRPIFGWGGYGRYQDWDPTTGISRNVMDGLWIIRMGEGGLVRFGTLFGLLLFPVFVAASSIDRVRSRGLRRVIAALAWIVTLRCVDLIPNSVGDSYLTLMSGALLAAVRVGSVPARAGARVRRAAAQEAATNPKATATIAESWRASSEVSRK